MRKPLPYGISALPGTRRTEHPDLVHVQFSRRRARQFIKLTDGASVKISMASIGQAHPARGMLMMTSAHA